MRGCISSGGEFGELCESEGSASSGLSISDGAVLGGGSAFSSAAVEGPGTITISAFGSGEEVYGSDINGGLGMGEAHRLAD